MYYAQKNIFLTVNTQKISIFLTSYFCVYFSERSPSEKYFSDGIRIFLCVFARTEECEFPVVFIHSVNPQSKGIEKSYFLQVKGLPFASFNPFRSSPIRDSPNTCFWRVDE